MNIKLTGTFTLLSPLSHIGETISTTAYLVQEPIPQPDGSIEEVFCYSGNAWRGQLRDLAAADFLDRLGTDFPVQSNQNTFHLLFSGGKIGGDQVVDISRIMTLREIIPVLSLFGGGLGNQIMAGKLKVSNCYPFCKEIAHLLPNISNNTPSYRQLNFEKSFSRKDDSRDGRLNKYLAVSTFGQPKEHKGPADQMRMTVELLAAGVQLRTAIYALDVNEIEVGCLFAALYRFARAPFIGGQSNRGHGQVALVYDMLDLDSGLCYNSLITIDQNNVFQISPDLAWLNDYKTHIDKLRNLLVEREVLLSTTTDKQTTSSVLALL